MINEYVQALVVTLQQPAADIEAVLRELQAALKRRHLSELYPQILRRLHKELARLENQSAPTVVVAKTADANAEVVKSSLKALAAESATPRIKVDPSLIGGAVVSYNHQTIDHSYKTRLKSLYQSLTT